MKKILLTLLSGIIFFVVLTLFSQEVQPDSSLYNFKRIYEKAVLLLKSNQTEKADYYSVLLEKRLSELEYVYKKDNTYILSSSLRHSTTTGEAVQFITNNNLTRPAHTFNLKLGEQKITLEKMAKEYRGYGDNGLFLRDAVNYTTIYQKSLEDFCKNKKCR